MSDHPIDDPSSDRPLDDQKWPTHCEHCGTALARGVIDFDKSNEDRAELAPGEMVAVDYCPNPDCPAKTVA
jgi:hypothetical protein